MEKLKRAIEIVHTCIKDYSALTKKDYIVFHSPHKSNEIKVTHINFEENNFLHLTGIEYRGSGTRFYHEAINSQLRIQDIQLKKDGTTQQKMAILPSVVKLPQLARIIGEHDGSGIRLHTDMIMADHRACCVGFVYDSRSILVPNTALNVDYRKCMRQPIEHIILTLSKDKNKDKYSTIEYQSEEKEATRIMKTYSHCIEEIIHNQDMTRSVTRER